jgi:hypothetical protein
MLKKMQNLSVLHQYMSLKVQGIIQLDEVVVKTVGFCINRCAFLIIFLSPLYCVGLFSLILREAYV